MTVRDDLIAIPDELLRSGRITQAVLVHMDFKDTPKRWWTGFGDLEVAGHIWQGVGDLISISPISSAYQVTVEKVTFELAATPEMLALALDAKARVRDRSVTIYLQLMATDGVTVAGDDIVSGQPVGSPMALYSGTMQRMNWGAEGQAKRWIALECEGLFARRNQPPRGRWNEADQQARHSGDRGFERMPLYASGYDQKWRG